ncbi:pheromone processing endoprotease [Entomophthora muscae]|uniref:Pheromone processing endoprotease n=1 Tax=Entomophthora muscae TaxID=34485 RepID=A0ACC2SVN9_9FUNG|nr:pheromone processing endoprotease [Entomophthora muscae]
MFNPIQLLVFLAGFLILRSSAQSSTGYDVSYHDYPQPQDHEHFDYYAVEVDTTSLLSTVERYFRIKYVERVGQLPSWYLFRARKGTVNPSEVINRFIRLNYEVDREGQGYRLVAQLKGHVQNLEHQQVRVYDFDHSEFKRSADHYQTG